MASIRKLERLRVKASPKTKVPLESSKLGGAQGSPLSRQASRTFKRTEYDMRTKSDRAESRRTQYNIRSQPKPKHLHLPKEFMPLQHPDSPQAKRKKSDLLTVLGEEYGVDPSALTGQPPTKELAIVHEARQSLHRLHRLATARLERILRKSPHDPSAFNAAKFVLESIPGIKIFPPDPRVEMNLRVYDERKLESLSTDDLEALAKVLRKLSVKAELPEFSGQPETPMDTNVIETTAAEVITELAGKET